MPGLITVSLQNFIVKGFHGLFPEERKTGNDFEIHLSVQYEPETELVTEIAETINYATLAELVKARMKEPADLLETVAMQITADIHEQFPQVKNVDVSISKLHPPITGFVGKVGVQFHQEF